jgi:hypothetical protein
MKKWSTKAVSPPKNRWQCGYRRYVLRMIL